MHLPTYIVYSLLYVLCAHVSAKPSFSSNELVHASLSEAHVHGDFSFMSNANEEHRRISEDDHDDDDKPKQWGNVIGATFLVNIATVLGVIFLIPICRKTNNDASGTTMTKQKNLLDLIIPSFAAGALIATAFFLTIPESISLIHTSITKGMEDSHADEDGNELSDEDGDGHHGLELPPATVWRFTVAILVGFLFPMILHIAFPNKHKSHSETDSHPNAAWSSIDTKGKK